MRLVNEVEKQFIPKAIEVTQKKGNEKTKKLEDKQSPEKVTELSNSRFD